jgi:hypothetical protein
MQAVGRRTRGPVRALTTSKAPNTKPNWKGKKKRQDNKDGTRARSTAAPAQAIIFPKLTFLSLKGLDFEYPSKHPIQRLQERPSTAQGGEKDAFEDTPHR